MEKLETGTSQREWYLDNNIFVRISGAGPGLVLFHNGFDASPSWDRVRDKFAKHFTVLEYDRQGYGRSYIGKTQLQKMDMVAEGCAEFDSVLAGLMALQNKELNLSFGPNASFALLGHCMGGAIAASWAHSHQERVKHLILEATGFFSDDKIRAKTDWALQAWQDLESSARDYLSQMHGDNAASIWHEISSHRSSYVMNANYDLRPKLAQLKMPVLIVQGNRDLYFNFEHAQAGADVLSNCKLLKISSGSHDYHQQSPSDFTQAVIDFIAEAQ